MSDPKTSEPLPDNNEYSDTVERIEGETYIHHVHARSVPSTRRPGRQGFRLGKAVSTGFVDEQQHKQM
jgi:hypothetical protein